MQVRRQPPADESSFGRPLPKAVQNSPYASVMAPGLHKKIARGKASSRTSSTNNQRQPRLSRDISDVDHLGKLGSPTSHHNGIPNELFAPSSNQNETHVLLSPRSAVAMGTPDGVVAYRNTTVRRSSNTDAPLAFPTVKGSIGGPSVSLLKDTSAKVAGNSKSTVSMRPTNSLNKIHSAPAFKMHNVGLTNLGNTCFMNSALQCILHVKPLVTYFSSGQFEKDINVSSPSKGKLASSFGELVRDMFSTSSGKSFTPTRFKKEITKLAPHLLDYEQQDCQEFLRFLLDGLSEDLGRLRAGSFSAPQAVSQAGEDTANTPASSLHSDSLLRVALGDDLPSSSPAPYSPITRPQPPPKNLKSSLPDKFRSRIRAVSTVASTDESLTHSDNIGSEQDSQVLHAAGEVEADITTFKSLQQRSSGREKGRVGALSDQLQQVLKESSSSWNNYLKKNDSVITDIFGGQLQSTIECLTCHHRSHTFDPFLDLSIPIEVPQSSKVDKEAAQSRRGGRGHAREPSSCSLEDCFTSFSAPELLEGDNAYNCEKCKSKQKSCKRLAIFRYPQILIIHIKRFRYTAIRREKMNTDVKFPSRGFNLLSYLSTDGLEVSKMGGSDSCPPPVYDLAGVTHHSGGLTGGHYVAHVDTGNHDPATRTRASDTDWLCFNDGRVSQSSVSSSGGPSAYMLFYRRQDNSSSSSASIHI